MIRTAVSLGGDCDTLTCIGGGIAEAFYGVPDQIIEEGRDRLAEDMLAMLDRFDHIRKQDNSNFQDPFLDGNELIEDTIRKYHANGQLPRKERLSFGVLSMVARLTAMNPKVMEKPFCHSKLSIRLQWQ